LPFISTSRVVLCFDNKIKELSSTKSWNVKEFFKSDYITNKKVEAWLCLAEIKK